MTRKYTDLSLTLPHIESLGAATDSSGRPHLALVAPDCDREDLLQVIRDSYEALRKMEGNTRALELLVSNILYECHTFPDVAACARHIEQEMNP